MLNAKYISVLLLSAFLSANAASQETSLVENHTKLTIFSSINDSEEGIPQKEDNEYIKEATIEHVDFLDEFGGECNYTLKLTIENKKSQLLNLSGFCTDNISLILEDFNFDGHPDLMMTTQELNDIHLYYELYLYSPEKEKFKYIKKDINNPSIRKEKKVITGVSKISAVEQEFAIYDFINKTISKFRFNYDENKGKATKYDLDNNIICKKDITKLEYEETLRSF